MKKILEEILFDIRKNTFIFSALTLQLAICFFVCIFSEQIDYEIKLRDSDVSVRNTENSYYKLVDNLVGDYEKNFFETEDAIGKLKIMYSMLISNDKFNYLEIYNNPIVLIGRSIKDELLYLYENGEAEKYRGVENGQVLNEVKCYWISVNVGSAFEFKFEEGSLWKEDEKNNDIIPVILGSEYNGIYQVGDIIYGITPIDGNVQMQVYGILEEGAYLVHNDRMDNLDRYVLMPLKDAKAVPLDKEDEQTQRILYLFKINGILQSGLSSNSLQDIIQDICNMSGIIPSSTVMGATNAQSYIFNESMANVLQMLNSMLTMLVAFAVVTTLFYMFIIIDKNKRYYAILSINGFSMKKIKGILLGNIIFPVILADFIAVIFSFLINFILNINVFPLERLILINAGLIIIVFYTSCIKLKHIDISLCIRGGEG